MKKKITTRKNKVIKGGTNNNGFTETLLPNQKLTKQKQINKTTTNLCKDIFILGKNTTKKNFIPSQFPKLTGLSQVYSQKIKKKEEEKLKKKQEEEKKNAEEQEIIEKAHKDVAGLKEATRKQEIYEKAVIQANNK